MLSVSHFTLIKLCTPAIHKWTFTFHLIYLEKMALAYVKIKDIVGMQVFKWCSYFVFDNPDTDDIKTTQYASDDKKFTQNIYKQKRNLFEINCQAFILVFPKFWQKYWMNVHVLQGTSYHLSSTVMYFGMCVPHQMSFAMQNNERKWKREENTVLHNAISYT